MYAGRDGCLYPLAVVEYDVGRMDEGCHVLGTYATGAAEEDEAGPAALGSRSRSSELSREWVGWY